MFEEWLNSPVRNTNQQTGFSKIRSCKLHTAGVRRVRDIWQEAAGTCIPSSQAVHAFGLQPSEIRHWDTLCITLQELGGWLRLQQGRPHDGEWIGIYHCPIDDVPFAVTLENIFPPIRLG
jgi:hypothetical protein